MTRIKQYKSGKFYQDEFRGDRSWNGNEHNVLYRSEGTDATGLPKFADVGMALGADDIKDARGMAVADFDNDGDLDIVVNTNPGDSGKTSVPPVLLRNEIGDKRNWLAIKLAGTTCNRDAVGTQVVIHCLDDQGQEMTMLRHVTAGGGYASQNSDRLYFGLGTVQQVQSITVRWTDGVVQEFHDLEANEFYSLQQGAEIQKSHPGQLARQVARQ